MFEYKKNDDFILSAIYLNSINMLFVNDATNWLENHLNAIRFLTKSSSNQLIVETFKFLLCERFSSKIVKTQSIFFATKLFDLKQKSNESLTIYYKRIINMMQRIDIRNRSITISIVVDTLSLLESTMLNIILKAFIRDLSNQKIKKKIIKNMTATNKSLRFIYQLIEETRRINLKIQKLFDDDFKRNELSFYKQLTMENLFKTQINSLFIEYHAAKTKIQNQFKSSQWTIHENSVNSSISQIFQQSKWLIQNQRYKFNRQSLISNFNRKNEIIDSSKQSKRFNQSYESINKKLYRSVSKNLSLKIDSKNSWINDFKFWSIEKDDRLCIRCNHLSHIAKKCKNEVLSAWKQVYFRKLMFENQSIQINFVTYDFEEFDENVRSYESYSIFEFTNNIEQSTSFNSWFSIVVVSIASEFNHFINYEIIDLSINSSFHYTDVKAVNIKYDENFDSNKKFHVEKSIVEQSQTDIQFQVDLQLQIDVQSQIDFQFQSDLQSQIDVQSIQNERQKKDQKKQSKKTKMISLMRMMNENTKFYDKSIFIRSILKNNKINMNWMKWLTYSSTTCKKFKKLCIKVIKKRISKIKFLVSNQSFQQFNFQFMSQYTQQFQSQMQNQMFQQFQMSSQQQIVYQQFQSIQTQQSFQMFSQSNTQQSINILKLISFYAVVENVSNDERYIWFLKILIEIDKVFRISCFVIKSNEKMMQSNKNCVQTNQKSNINVMSIDMIHHLKLKLHSLKEIEFKNLSMRTANHWKTMLHYWIWFEISIKNITRNIRYFVVSEISHTTTIDVMKFLNLIFDFFWLYSINVLIDIREFKILIENNIIDELTKKIVDSELMFCNDHNLFMYSKSVVNRCIQFEKWKSIIVENVSDFEDSNATSASDNEINLSNVEESKFTHKQNFRWILDTT